MFLRREYTPLPGGKRLIAECQMQLAVIWLLPCLSLFVLMMFQTFTGRLTNPELGWKWLVATVLPTLSVIVGGIVHSASDTKAAFAIDVKIYNLCKWISYGYLVIVVLTLVLAGPYATQKTPEEWLSISNFWITPLQAPLGIVLGVFFASSTPTEKPKDTAGD